MRGTIQIRSMHRIVPDAENKTPVDVLKQIFAGLAPEIKRQLEQDVVIWEKKVSMPRPMLAGGVGRPHSQAPRMVPAVLSERSERVPGG